MKKVLGYFLIALPFILVIVAWLIVDWKNVLMAVGVMGFVVLSVWTGCKLAELQL